MSTDSYLAYYYNFIKSEDIELILEHIRVIVVTLFSFFMHQLIMRRMFMHDFCVFGTTLMPGSVRSLKRLVYDAQL